ncbi:MAG: KpsF/GutQ family sugar-phosphate isomerase [Pseudomonadota bacterium]
MLDTPKSIDPVASAVRTLETEIAGLTALKCALENELSEPLKQAVTTLGQISGRVIVTGVGKSGHIATKIAATLASTGTPAFFVHPSEANHGDLGMIARDDAIIAISWSGETTELHGTLNYSQRFSIPLIAITSNGASTLANQADIVLALPKEKEACPNNLAPTTSSVMQLCLLDAVAVALLESRNFSPADFGIYHPGGQLGAKLTRVGEIMHTGERVPLIASGSLMTEAIMQISEKGFGCVGVVKEDQLIGIVTDGDLRRHLSINLLGETVDTVMNPNPKTVSETMLASKALEMLNAQKISTLMVARDGRAVGILHLHDLLRLGVA